MFRTALLAITVLATPAVLAKGEIYKWVDQDGVVHYGSEAPRPNAQPAQLPQLQTYKAAGGKTAPISTLDANSTAQSVNGVALKDIKITAPAAEETVRDAEGNVPVTVQVLPALPRGAGLVVYLDGKRQNAKPWQATSYTLTQVERGTHNVSVVVVNADGKEVLRSKPVVFYSKPPSAK